MEAEHLVGMTLALYLAVDGFLCRQREELLRWNELPQIVIRLLPSVIGGPLILYMLRKR
jgi:hypothetical protein